MIIFYVNSSIFVIIKISFAGITLRYGPIFQRELNAVLHPSIAMSSGVHFKLSGAKKYCLTDIARNQPLAVLFLHVIQHGSIGFELLGAKFAFRVRGTVLQQIDFSVSVQPLLGILN